MVHVMNVLFVDSIVAQWFFLLFLILMNALILTTNKKIGFQVTYVTLLSLAIALIMYTQLPYIYTRNEAIPITVPLLQALTTFFLLFIPLVKSRLQLAICILTPMIIGSFMFFQAISLISIINALIIGGFIVYAFYRTLDWLAGVPEPYLVIFAFLLPLFIGGILYPHYQYMIIPGILLGSGVGTVLEALKIRINPVRLTFFQRSCAIIIGSTGILILLYGIDLFANVTIIHTFILGSLIGGWITFFMPMLLVVLNIYPTETRTKMY